MKTFLVIGMNPFGSHLCRELTENGCEVMAVDKDSKALEEVLPLVCSAKVGDCTNKNVLKAFDVASFDACFVCVGSDFQASLEIISLLKDFGAKKIFGNAHDDIQAKFFLRNGADEVIYPERTEARRIAVSESRDSIFDCIKLSGEYSVYEIQAPEKWFGKSIRELNVRDKFKLSILAVKKDGEMFPMPGADYVFETDDHIVVLGKIDDVGKVAKK